MLTRRFNLLEFAAVMLVVAVVVYVLFSRAIGYLEIAEKAAMTVTVLEVERGTRIRFAMAAMKSAPAPPAKWREINPFEFAHAVPPNYLGELSGEAELRELKPGNWFYDRDRHAIAYLPRLASRFRSETDSAAPIIRFRVANGGGGSSLPRLVSVAPYQWEPEFGTF